MSRRLSPTRHPPSRSIILARSAVALGGFFRLPGELRGYPGSRRAHDHRYDDQEKYTPACRRPDPGNENNSHEEADASADAEFGDYANHSCPAGMAVASATFVVAAIWHQTSQGFWYRIYLTTISKPSSASLRSSRFAITPGSSRCLPPTF